MAAEQRGVFRGKPSSQAGEYYLLRAGRTTDDPPLEHAPFHEDDPVGPYSGMSWPELKKLAKERLPDINMHEMKRDEVEARLERNDVADSHG